jgi:hypothetical protein
MAGGLSDMQATLALKTAAGLVRSSNPLSSTQSGSLSISEPGQSERVALPLAGVALLVEAL